MPRVLDARAAGLTAVAMLGVTAYCVLFSRALDTTSYDLWGYFLVAPILLTLSLPVLARLVRDEQDSVVVTVVFAGLVLKLLSALPRYWMAFVLYEGNADSAMYAEVASTISREFRNFDFNVDIGTKVMGTGFLVIVTGVVFVFTGPTTLGGFVFFSWMGFWGLFFFYRAFKVAMPDADLRRYCLLLFLLPSMLFWPSSIGKDTWMLLCLGVFSYGAALLLERRPGAFLFLALGVLGTVFLRPHVTLIACAALAVATVFRRSPDKLTALGPLRSILTFGALGLGLMMVLAKLTAFLGTDSLQVSSSLQGAAEMTGQGGSEVESAPATSPVDLPWGIVTVLFRPFPFEAHNVQSFITSAEGTLLLGLIILSIPRLRGILGYARKRPYVVYAIVYMLLFCYIFSSFQNFGILARERVMVFPLVIVLLALPKPEEVVRSRPGIRPQQLTGSILR